MTEYTIDGYPVDQHPTVTRLMKGVYNKRPPPARYSYTWDMYNVTSHYVKLGHQHELLPENVVIKTFNTSCSNQTS